MYDKADGMKLVESEYEILNRILNNRIVQHSFYWTSYLFFFGYMWGTYDDNFQKSFLIEIINIPLKMIMVYFIVYHLLPRYLFQKKILHFFAYFAITILLTAIIRRYTDNYVIQEYFLVYGKLPILDPNQFIYTLLKINLVLVLPMTLKITENVFSSDRKQRLLEKEKLEAELMFLKNQTHPHFLFNTLNNLYSLVLKKSDKSLNVILKLSELLRYMLYETNASRVSIQKELNSIKSYIELEKIRYGKRVDLSFNTWGNFTVDEIAPMLIIPFIENSFKHCTSGSNGEGWITIDMSILEHSFSLKIENSIPTTTQEITDAHGIGLKNVKRRLELLYEKDHELIIEESSDSYLVNLKLNLKARG